MLLGKRLSAAVLLAWVGCLAAVPAARAQVEDAAHLFHPQAVRKADQRIEEMRQRFGKTLRIETIDAPPAERVRKINLGDAKMRDEDFDQWTRERIAAAKLDGIYVLVCLKPRYVRVTVHPDEIGETLFTEDDQRFLHRLMDRWLQKQHRNDDHLLIAVDYVGDKLSSHAPVDMTQWLLGLSVIGGILCFWALLGTIRVRLRKRTPAEAGVRVEDESGRSIAVLGGGIGAVSGQWLFDRLTRPRRRSAAPVPQNLTAPEREQPEHFPEEP